MLSTDDWRQLLHLAHTNRRRAFETYSSHYLSTDGQLYWSDTHQLSVYLDDYHRELDERLGAKESYSCVVFNLHIAHTPQGVKKAKEDFRRLIDRAIEYGGSYYLTYHRWATREQVLACYPQMPEFLRLKKLYDSSEVFQSDWYRHHRALLES